ncbi:MAG: hypothetical protein ABI451_07425, partial [Dokdonella sp.]
MSTFRLLPLALSVAAFSGLAMQGVEAMTPSATPQVTYDTHHDVSRPLRDMAAEAGPATPKGTEAEPYEIPNIFLKNSGMTDIVPLSPLKMHVQESPIFTPAPATIVAFNTINSAQSACGCLPPDTNGDVGPSHFFQWVNSRYAIYDKTGATVLAATLGNTLFAGFGGVCQTSNSGDPVVLFDHEAQRWMASQFYSPTSGNTNATQCVAVSTSSDPLGTYNRYQFNSTFFGDYPHFGIWVDESGTQDSYLLTTHEFDRANGSAFVGARMAALQRDQMLQNLPAAMVAFGGFDAYGVMALHMNGTVKAPGYACPVFTHFDGLTSEYRFWDMCLDWTTPANSTITMTPSRLAANAPFIPTPIQAPQPVTANRLDAFGSNTMNRASARAYPAGAPSRVSAAVSHTVLVNADIGNAEVRWVKFGMNPPNDRIFAHDFESATALPPLPLTMATAPYKLAKQIVDEGIYGPDGTTRFLPSIAIDKNDNLAVGYSASSTTVEPQMRYTGRTNGDPIGTMEDEVTCTPVTTGHQTSTSGRWGDYASMSVDPTDQCTFWFNSEFYASTGSATWATRVCSFKFANCGTADYALVADTPRRVEMCAVGATADPS